MARAKKKATVHVILGDKGTIRCTHCGATHQPFKDGKPIELWELTSVMKGFAEKHKRCPKPATPRCTFCHSPDHASEEHVAKTTTIPEQWPDSGDTGISSTAIYRHMMGMPSEPTRGPWPPSDPSDFGRCHRLLGAPWAVDDAGRRWRSRIGEMAKYPGWAALVAVWDELEALYVEEVAKGDSAPKLYARMKQLEGRG